MPRNPLSSTSGQVPAHIVETAAISGSLICLAHCLALPLLLLIVPGALMLFVQSEAFHLIALGLLAPSAALAFWLGYRRHRNAYVALCGLAGILMLALALLPRLGEGGEVSLTVAGSIFLIVGHLANWRFRTSI